MKDVLIIARREFFAYFANSLAAVFLAVFVGGVQALTFFVGDFFEAGQANLVPFFSFHPWLFLVLIPAIAMRLWAEERRVGTLEFLMTLPIMPWQAVIGKFLAAWIVAGLALVLTFPIWVTVNYLGDPDNGVILAGYVGCLLVAGAFLAIGAAVSALTKNQVIAFVLAVAICFVFTVAGTPVVTEFLSDRMPVLAEMARAISVSDRFGGFTRGVVSARDIVFFGSFMAFFLFVNAVILDHRKAD